MSNVPNWDDEVIHLLDNKYQDWRHPSRTYMVPCVFPCIKRKLTDGEKTEKTFFELLQGFGESRSEGMFVVHSYHFAELISEWNEKSIRREEKWLIGEHDFVVIHHQLGIIYFQVKAADSRRGKFADAAKQITKDKKALQAFIAKNIQGKMKKEIGHELFSIFPGFVVMPNCPCPDGSVVNPPTGVFKENCENVEAFSTWWDKNAKRQTVIHQKLYEFFVMRFVGMSLSTPHIDEDKEVCMKEQLSGILNSVSKQLLPGPVGVEMILRLTLLKTCSFGGMSLSTPHIDEDKEVCMKEQLSGILNSVSKQLVPGPVGVEMILRLMRNAENFAVGVPWLQPLTRAMSNPILTLRCIFERLSE